MNEQAANAKTVTRLLFRLLPVQILLASVNSVNGIVSSYFASNYVGVEAMSAVGLYSPIGMLITSVNAILVGGSVILSGEYMGKNQRDKLQGVFSLNLTVTSLIAAIFTLILLTAGLFDLTGFLTEDRVVRQLLDRYLIGQAVGVLPLMLGGSFSSFLSLENRGKRR